MKNPKTQTRLRKNPKNNNGPSCMLLPVKVLEHTADIGLEVSAQNKKELFCRTAQAMFELIGSIRSKDFSCEKTFSIDLKADDLEQLFFDWLGHLLMLSDIHTIIFIDFNIQKLSKTHLKAKAIAVDLKKHIIRKKTQIKAVTYHQLKIETLDNKIQARVFFDI